MKRVSLVTDGACLGNPGPGGWACLLRFGGATKELFGFDPHTTNNRMELDQLNALHQTTWLWTRGHAGHEDNTRCDLLAQTAASTQRSSWPDNRPHAPLLLNLGADYVPPKPQAGLFEDSEPGGEDDDDSSDD